MLSPICSPSHGRTIRLSDLRAASGVLGMPTGTGIMAIVSRAWFAIVNGFMSHAAVFANVIGEVRRPKMSALRLHISVDAAASWILPRLL